tara:strand:- start:173 stop:571 length:399 start_codon:yes stop_codon:yes gene_type:complete
MDQIKRPKITAEKLENAIELANLSEKELDIIEFIRYIGTFDQTIVVKALNLESKPPALSILCDACRKIGNKVPDHFQEVRKWSESISLHGVRWDGDLICSTTFNIDGIRLTPECGTTQYHQFCVHPEFFNGL